MSRNYEARDWKNFGVGLKFSKNDIDLFHLQGFEDRIFQAVA